MRDDFSSQINKFLEGFHEIVPQECISYFEAKELELLISGVPEVDLEDLKGNTDYSGYNPTDQIIVWFWEVVSDYSQEDLAKLVQFITGTSKIPVEGFSQIVGMNGIQRISIHRDPCEHQLPKSHTCFNQLDLPNYASKEILKTKLGICLAWGSEGFGFM
jgi:E3 ubiquitin-protein ligase HUWE1